MVHWMTQNSDPISMVELEYDWTAAPQSAAAGKQFWGHAIVSHFVFDALPIHKTSGSIAAESNRLRLLILLHDS